MKNINKIKILKFYTESRVVQQLKELLKREFALPPSFQQVNLHSQKHGEVFDYAAETFFLVSFSKYSNSHPGEIKLNKWHPNYLAALPQNDWDAFDLTGTL